MLIAELAGSVAIRIGYNSGYSNFLGVKLREWRVGKRKIRELLY
jgi:hypothetical protein